MTDRERKKKFVDGLQVRLRKLRRENLYSPQVVKALTAMLYEAVELLVEDEIKKEKEKRHGRHHQK